MKEPSNTDVKADAELVAAQIRKGLPPDQAEQMAMLFHDPEYRLRVYALAAVMLGAGR